MKLSIFENRNNSMEDYLTYLLELSSVKLEQVTKGDATLMEYHLINQIITDLSIISNKK